MRIRLRPAHDPGKLAELYAKPHQHDRWPDHVLRVNETIKLIRDMFPKGVPNVVADLSCGDAAIVNALRTRWEPIGNRPSPQVILGDIAPGYEFTGPIEQTIREVSRVGLFVCCETLEHLDDPETVLAQIRAAADCLVLSTPDSEPDATNQEHYWSWGQDDVRAMLEAAGWKPELSRVVTWKDGHDHPWSYQIWGCR